MAPIMTTDPTARVGTITHGSSGAALACWVICDDALDDRRIPQLSVSASRDAGGRVTLTRCILHPRQEGW